MDRDPLPSKRPGGKRAAPKVPPSSTPISDAVALMVDALGLSADDLQRRTLAALALNLAAELDSGAGMASAAIAKELRAIVADLGGDGASDDDAFSEWERQLGSAT